MEIFGKRYSTNELRKRVGSMDQIAGIKVVQLDDGNERPTRAALFRTGSGLEFTVLLDRGMDISSSSFCGKAMGWRSTTGDVAPQYFEPEGIRWIRSFYGGLLCTCGLMNVGAPREESALLGTGLHGRISNLPARDVKISQGWVGNEYVLAATGSMRETRVFAENIVLTRSVSTVLGGKRIWVHDTITNEGFKNTKFQVLYHCNIGWPVIDAGSEMISPSRFVAPRDATAEDGKQDWYKFSAPIHNYAEKCYYHDMAADRTGMVTVALVNDGFKSGNGFGVYVKYNRDSLPRFTEWKQMGEQDYVVGLEPCNCGVEGREIDERQGLLHTLRPGESRCYMLEFGPITDIKEVKALKASCAKVKTQIIGSYKQFVKKP